MMLMWVRPALSSFVAHESIGALLHQQRFSLRSSNTNALLPPPYRYQPQSQLRLFSSSFAMLNAEAPVGEAAPSEADSEKSSREGLLSMLEEIGEDLGDDLQGEEEELSEAEQRAFVTLLAGEKEGPYDSAFDNSGVWDINKFPPVYDNRAHAHELVKQYYLLRDKALKSEAIGEELFNQDDLVAAALGSFQPDQLTEFVTLRCGFARPLSDDHIRLIEKRVMRIAGWLLPEQIAVFIELFCTYSREYNVKVKTLKTLTELLPNFPEIEFRAINSIIETVDFVKFPLSKRVGSHLYRLLKQASDNGDRWEEDVDVYISDEDEQEQKATN